MKRVVVRRSEIKRLDHWKIDAYINEKLYKAGYRPHLTIKQYEDFRNNRWIFEWEEEKMKIYLASGWFNEEQMRRVQMAEEVLEKAGHEVFSPRKQQNEHLEFGTKEWREATFNSDVDHINWADIIVAVYNEEDAGTMWELGYAYAKGKPAIVINEDGMETMNLMISDSLECYLETWEGLKIVLKDLEYTFNIPKIAYEGSVI
jgi:nucleoside 2-deoxyribosyltransferase